MSITREDYDLVSTILRKCVTFYIDDTELEGDVLFDFGRTDLSDLKANEKKISKFSLHHIELGLNLFESLSHLPSVKFFTEKNGHPQQLGKREFFFYDMIEERGFLRGKEVYVTKILSNYIDQLNPKRFMNTYISNIYGCRLFNRFVVYVLEKEQVAHLPNKTANDWKSLVNKWYQEANNGKTLSDAKIEAFITFLPKTREELEKEEVEDR